MESVTADIVFVVDVSDAMNAVLTQSVSIPLRINFRLMRKSFDSGDHLRLKLPQAISPQLERGPSSLGRLQQGCRRSHRSWNHNRLQHVCAEISAIFEFCWSIRA